MKRLFLFFALTLSLSAQRNRVDNAPAVGDPIPRTSATKLTDQTKVDLSNPEKITVLIFGSHT